MTTINNVTRLLDSRKVVYEAHVFPPQKLGALEVAQLLNVPPEQVFKTIVVTREKKKPILALVPGPRFVDLKRLASFLAEKKVFLPTEREAEQLTGLRAGGISPLALLHKGFEVVIDSSAQNFEQIFISGGQRGLDIKLSVFELVKIVNARFGEVSRQNES